MTARNVIVLIAIFSLISFAMGFWTGVLVEGHNLKPGSMRDLTGMKPSILRKRKARKQMTNETGQVLFGR